MKRCPTLQEWLDLAEQRLSPARAAQLEAHLTHGCASCSQQQAWVGRILTTLPQARPQRLSAQTRQTLRTLAAERLAAQEKPLWITTLLRDTRQRPTVGVRGGDEGIQLRYEAELYELRLWAEPSAANHWYVIGQIFEREQNRFITPEAVALIGPSGQAQTGHTEDAEFHLAEVAQGTYRLALRLPQAELLVPELMLEGV